MLRDRQIAARYLPSESRSGPDECTDGRPDGRAHVGDGITLREEEAFTVIGSEPLPNTYSRLGSATGRVRLPGSAPALD